MRFFLDCEFNGFGGELLSMALVCDRNNKLHSFYLKVNYSDNPLKINDWVAQHVIPVMDAPTFDHNYIRVTVKPNSVAYAIQEYFLREALFNNETIDIVADWPDDIAYFCRALLDPQQPGVSANFDGLKFVLKRIESFPTDLQGAVQHNALWDAFALRHVILKEEDNLSPNKTQTQT